MRIATDVAANVVTNDDLSSNTEGDILSDTTSDTTMESSVNGRREKKPSSMDQGRASSSRASSALSRPFQIVQLGDPRSASTFQFELLCSVVTWKMLPQTADTSKIPCEFVKRRFINRQLQQKVDNNETFVYKAHNDPGLVQELAKTTHLAVFSSGGAGSAFAIYTQNKEEVKRCPECEVDHYQALFHLSNQEVSQLKEHMKIFGILRQCCGLQMSKYEMHRLHGCDIHKYLDRPSYPNCEQYSEKQLQAMEETFATGPVPFRVKSPEYNWAKPGDCARFKDDIITNGKGFNGEPFLGCQDIP